MKLLLRQRIFSWFDSFDIYDEEDRTVFTVEGQLSWGHRLEIYDPTGAHLGTVKERVLTFLPQFELYAGEQYLGCIRKEFTFFRPSFTLDFNGWSVDGNWMEWGLRDSRRRRTECGADLQGAPPLERHLCHRRAPAGLALAAVMIVLAIDAEKCSRN